MYSPAVHGYYGSRDGRVVVSYTNHPNQVEAVEVEFGSGHCESGEDGYGEKQGELEAEVEENVGLRAGSRRCC